MIDTMIEIIRDHPVSAIICLTLGVGMLFCGVLLSMSIKDWQRVRQNNGAGAATARHNIRNASIDLFKMTVLFAIAALQLANSIATIHALPPWQRAAALHRAQRLSPIIICIVVLWCVIVATIVGASIYRVLWRRYFDHKYERRAG